MAHSTTHFVLPYTINTCIIIYKVYTRYMKKTKFLFNIDEDVKLRLAIEAGYRVTSISNIINGAIDLYLMKCERERKNHVDPYPNGISKVDPGFDKIK